MTRDEIERIQKISAQFSHALAKHLMDRAISIDWAIQDDAFLAMRCEQEIAELRYEIDYVGRDGGVRESLDVAAYAMMIWDNLSRSERADEERLLSEMDKLEHK